MKNKISKFIVLFNCLAIFCMVAVITVSAGYTVFLGDDYTHGVRIGAFHVPFFQYVLASLRYMKEIYLDWQGTYFAMFLQALLSPLNNFGLAQLKVVMICNSLFFFGSLLGVYWAATGFIFREGKDMAVRLSIFTVVLFAILDADIFTEIFFWYSGAVSYSIPFSFLLLSVACFLKSNYARISEKSRNVFTICAVILIFLASGGSLTVSGTGCYAVLLLTLGFYLVSKRNSGKNMIILASGIAGALVNVAAPGNFSRHTYNSGENSWQLVQTVKWTVKIVWHEIARLTGETMFGLALVIMVMIGIYLSKKVRPVLNAYTVVSVLALGCGYVTVFPVILGYGGTEFPNRCYFILDTVLVVSLLNFALLIGCYLDRWLDLSGKKNVGIILFALLLISFVFSPEFASGSEFCLVAKSLVGGSYRNYYEGCAAVYDYLEHCPEDDVVLELPGYIENFECFYLDEDEEGWVNVGMAQFYHKNSVKRKTE